MRSLRSIDISVPAVLAAAIGRWSQQRTFVVAAAVALLGACGGGGSDKTPSAPPAPPSTVLVKNYLYLPLTLTADGVAYGNVNAGNGFGPGQVTITLPGSVKSLSAAVQPLRYTDGSPVPNDLTGGSFSISGSTTVSATNVQEGQVYLMLDIANQSGIDLLVAVAQGSTVQCIGTIPKTSTLASWWGYYRLASITQVRLYNTGTSCTGPYLYWDSAALSGYASNTGVILLLANSAPKIPVSSVVIAPSSASVTVGSTSQLTATMKDASGNVLTGRTVTWSSSNTASASVSSSGLVTAVAVGSAQIAATSEGSTAVATITVVAPAAVASVTVSPGSAIVTAGRTQQLTSTLKDAGGTTLTGRSVTWSTSAASVATVSSSGLVSAVAPGTATITATSEGKTGTAAITVVPEVVDRIEICDRAHTISCWTSGYTSYAGAAISVRASAYSASNSDISASCVFVWAASVPSAVSIVPSTDATHRDALITRLVNFTTVAVTASCGGQTGVFTP